MSPLYPFASFLGAFLLFLVQPLMAKQVLPWFGGAASVWSTCLVFFQLALVAGYAYAHLTKRLGLRWQVALHAGLLLLAAVMLPIEASRAWQPPDSDAPVSRLLLLLLGVVGAPYVLVAATAPLLQHWYAQRESGTTPYRLYVYSNIGSLAGLLLYPLVIERFYLTSAQAVGWSLGYGVFLLVCVGCGWQALASPHAPSSRVAALRMTRQMRVDGVCWFLLAACGSGLLLAITNRMCQDVAAIPLLWVVPLALYLVTFILCFAGLYHRTLWAGAFAVGLALAAYAAIQGAALPVQVQVLSLGFLLFAACMVCHGELVRLTPPPEGLTLFYLVLAAGGAAGGMFVALLAPVLFTTYVELPLLLALSTALVLVIVARERARAQGGRPPAFLVAAIAGTMSVAVAFTVVANNVSPSTVAVDRNFYGILRVTDDPPGRQPRLRRLSHGQIVHGVQSLNASTASDTLTYYGSGSGVDHAFRTHPERLAGRPLTVGVIGLGAGSLANLTQAGDRLTFFELDPQVAAFAREHFTFLRDAQGAVNVVLGDARLSLEREMEIEERHGAYDLLVVDAFSGDSIPIHLLTREAFDVYRQALRPGGVLAVHISNLYLNLEPVVGRLAASLGMEATLIRHPGDDARGTLMSEWMVLADDAAFVARLRNVGTPAVTSGGPPWTDGFSSLVGALR